MNRLGDIVLHILFALFVLACIPPAIILMMAFTLADLTSRATTRGKKR